MTVDPYPDHIHALIVRLGDPDWAIQEQASHELVGYGARVVPALITALGEKDTWYGAAETLAQLGAPAVEPLIAVLNDPWHSNFAVHALQRMGAPAVLPLVHALPQSRKHAEAQGWIRILLEWFSEPEKCHEVIHSLDPGLYLAAATALAEDK